MATPRARGGISLTRLPPITRSPLVCCSSPQMMRRNVVLPQPDGPSSTMNSPSGTVSEMPLTAGTSPNFLTISLANTADIEPPRIQCDVCRARPAGGTVARFCPFGRFPLMSAGPGRAAHEGAARTASSGLAGPLLHDGLALTRGLLDRVFGAHLARGCPGHHVVEDERVVDLVHRGRGRSRITRDGGPFVRVLQDGQLVLRRRGLVVRQNRHRLRHEILEAWVVVTLARLEGFRPVIAIVLQELDRGFLILGEFPDAVEFGSRAHDLFRRTLRRLDDEGIVGLRLIGLLVG